MSEEPKLLRKPIQIAIGQREDEDGDPIQGSRLFALCDDGSIWYNDMRPLNDEWVWWTLPTLPQGPRQDIGDAFERDPDDFIGPKP